MAENRNMRIWQWAVLLLVLCNMGLIATMWLRPGHRLPPVHGGPGGPRDYVVQQLKFTDEQVKQYDALIHAHRQTMQQLQQEGAKLREALFANLGNDKAGSAADSIAQLIGANQREIELSTYHHFEAVRALCTDEQKKKFDDITGDVLRQMGGPHHAPGDRPGPPDGQGPPPGDQQGPPPQGSAPPR